MGKEAIDAIRQPDACPKCYERMARDNPGGEDVRKRFAKHLKAICWAYICDECAEIMVGAIRGFGKRAESAKRQDVEHD